MHCDGPEQFFPSQLLVEPYSGIAVAVPSLLESLGQMAGQDGEPPPLCVADADGKGAARGGQPAASMSMQPMSPEYGKPV